jgi:hypothetical protein
MGGTISKILNNKIDTYCGCDTCYELLYPDTIIERHHQPAHQFMEEENT